MQINFLRNNKKYEDIRKQQNKILPAGEGRILEDIPTTGCKKIKTILEQNMGTKRS